MLPNVKIPAQKYDVYWDSKSPRLAIYKKHILKMYTITHLLGSIISHFLLSPSWAKVAGPAAAVVATAHRIGLTVLSGCLLL